MQYVVLARILGVGMGGITIEGNIETAKFVCWIIALYPH